MMGQPPQAEEQGGEEGAGRGPINMTPPQTRLGGRYCPDMLSLPVVSNFYSRETKVISSNNFTSQVSPTKKPLVWAELLPNL